MEKNKMTKIEWYLDLPFLTIIIVLFDSFIFGFPLFAILKGYDFAFMFLLSGIGLAFLPTMLYLFYVKDYWKGEK